MEEKNDMKYYSNMFDKNIMQFFRMSWESLIE